MHGDRRKNLRKDGNFVGYTFNRDQPNQNSTLLAALIDLERLKPSRMNQQIKEVNWDNLAKFNFFSLGKREDS